MSIGDVANVASILGLIVTVAGMFWFKRKGKRPSRPLIPFCTLMLLLFTQFLSAKILGKGLLPDVTLVSMVTLLVLGIFWLARDEE
jgi:hypothetical protein